MLTTETVNNAHVSDQRTLYSESSISLHTADLIDSLAAVASCINETNVFDDKGCHAVNVRHAQLLSWSQLFAVLVPGDGRDGIAGTDVTFQGGVRRGFHRLVL